MFVTHVSLWIFLSIPFVLFCSAVLKVVYELTNNKKQILMSYLAVFLLVVSLALVLNFKVATLVFISLIFILPETISFFVKKKIFEIYPTSFILIAGSTLIYAAIAIFFEGP